MLSPGGDDPNDDEDPNKNHPWKLEYFQKIRDMYHPFLYDNHVYCQISRRTLNEILNERDIYVKTIQIDVMDALLTDEQRAWVHHLRDCCLFEVHRRKYRLVLNEMMARVNRRRDSQGVSTLYLGSYARVTQWLGKCTYPIIQELDEEDLEYQRLNQEIPALTEPGTTVQDEPTNVSVEDEVLFQETLLPVLPEPPGDSYPTLECPEELEVVPQPDEPIIERNEDMQQDEAAAFPLPPVNRQRELVLYEEYPRDFFYAHPELFEVHTAASLGKLFSDPEYNRQRRGRRKELREMARQREIAIAKYYAQKGEQAKIPQQIDDDCEMITLDPVEYDDCIQPASQASCDLDDNMSWSASDMANEPVLSSSDETGVTQVAAASRKIGDDEMPSTSQTVDTSKGAIKKQYFSKKTMQKRGAAPSNASSESTVSASDIDDEYLTNYLKEGNQMVDIFSDEPTVRLQMSSMNLSEEIEIDCTLPPIEPDFMNLPLPETPEERKYD